MKQLWYKPSRMKHLKWLLTNMTVTETIGINRIIAISDISRIEQNQSPTGKTIGAVAGGIFVAGLFSK